MKKKKQGYRKSFRTKKKKSIFKSRIFWIAVLVFLLISGLFYFFILSPVFQIKEIRVSGSYKSSSEEIRKIVEENIETKLLFLSTKTIFFDGFSKPREEIMESFPVVYQVKIKRDFPSSLEVLVEERIAAATWRFEENNFLLDSKGVVFEKNQSVKEPVISGGRKVSLGESVIEESLVRSILEVNSKLEGEGIEVKEFLISFPKLTLRTEAGWEAYFDLEGNISTQVSNLVLVLEEEITQPKTQDLEYIDLRFQERIFYKFKDSI